MANQPWKYPGREPTWKGKMILRLTWYRPIGPCRVWGQPHWSCSNPWIHHKKACSSSLQQMNGNCKWRGCRICVQNDDYLRAMHRPMWLLSHSLHACSRSCMCVQQDFGESSTVSTHFMLKKNHQETKALDLFTLLFLKTILENNF